MQITDLGGLRVLIAPADDTGKQLRSLLPASASFAGYVDTYKTGPDISRPSELPAADLVIVTNTRWWRPIVAGISGIPVYLANPLTDDLKPIKGTEQKRIGLPWSLSHYRHFNGAHPLVRSYIDASATSRFIDISLCPPAAIEDICAMASPAIDTTRTLSVEHAKRLTECLNLADQATIQNCVDQDALFLHTSPLCLSHHPFVFHFESFQSLFLPFLRTGQTRGVDLVNCDYFRFVRDRLSSSKCLAIISHMKGSLNIASAVFNDHSIDMKLTHIPIGVETISADIIRQKHDRDGPLKVLFTNSLHNGEASFFLRGGHNLIDAFFDSMRRGANLSLTIISSVPKGYEQLATSSAKSGITWIRSTVSDDKMAELLHDHHIYAMPSAGLHSYSLLKAIGYGCVPIVSDALGYEEWLEATGAFAYQIRGVRDMVYRDEPGGWISDSYEGFYDRIDTFRRQLADILTDASLRSDLSVKALQNADVARTQFSLDQSRAAFDSLLRNCMA
jgi:hypothetical protein